MLVIERILRDREGVWRQIVGEQDLGKLIGTMIVRDACRAIGHWSYVTARPGRLGGHTAWSAGDLGLCATGAWDAIGPWALWRARREGKRADGQP